MDKVKEPPAVTIRQPATANLMVDSKDRLDAYPSPWKFTIQRNQSILNGFFNRIGTTEVVFEWNENNVDEDLKNNEFSVRYPSGGAGTTYTATLPNACYTISEVLDEIVSQLNSQTAPNTWDVFVAPWGAQIKRVDNAVFDLVSNPSGGTFLYQQLGYLPAILPQVGLASYDVYRNRADLTLIRYIDFVCSQLTYNQDLKDGATQEKAGDVLCRWYLAYDQPTTDDTYGFPIYMTYALFKLRRLFNPPKQIKWDNIQPVGNLSFELYGASTQLNEYQPLAYFFGEGADRTNWLMTLQVSEN